MSNIENPPSSVYTGWFQNGFLIDDETLNQLESQFFKTSSPSSDIFSLNPPILIYMIHIWRCLIKNSVLNPLDDHHVGMGQNPIPLVNIKIAGKWMFIPLKMVLIGIDPYPFGNKFGRCACRRVSASCSASWRSPRSASKASTMKNRQGFTMKKWMYIIYTYYI